MIKIEDLPEEIQKSIKGAIKELGEKGLTGNSGFLTSGQHVSANYDAGEGNVFVKSFKWRHSHTSPWERMKIEKANECGIIIKCYYCNKPAITIDHYWPYEQDHTVCEDHLDKLDG